MSITSKKSTLLTVVAIAMAFAIATVFAATSQADAEKTYRVTVENLTTGQPFTPPAIATHNKALSIYNVSQPASAEIAAIAENGDYAPLMASLETTDKVHDSLVGPAPLVPAGDPGESGLSNVGVYEITAAGNARVISLAWMLICTNDGFSGLSQIVLPTEGSAEYYTQGYDASTEVNTEDFADIVPPCQGLIGVTSDDEGTGMSNPALAEGGDIFLHQGVFGGNDLIAQHDWDNPVAKVTIELISD